MNNSWCILRTSGPRTLPLAESLERSGVAAWTPTHAEKRRASRGRNVVVTLPLLPGYVFADYARTRELIAIRRAPETRIRFWLVASSGVPAQISAREMAEFRSALGFRPKVSKRLRYERGREVRIEGGLYSGMTGVVEQHRGDVVTLWFPVFGKRVKISACVLPEKEAVEAPSFPVQAEAA